MYTLKLKTRTARQRFCRAVQWRQRRHGLVDNFMKNNVFKEIVKGLLATVVLFVILEAVLRIAYFGRNWMVTEIPVPHVFGDDHGPIPPWLDGLRILESDKVLIWKNRPNLQRKYIDVFSPAGSEQEKTALLGFFPYLPDSLKGNGDPAPVPSPIPQFAKRESNLGNFA